jgi:hypothetical protein
MVHQRWNQISELRLDTGDPEIMVRRIVANET